MPAETARDSAGIADPPLLVYWVILGRITLPGRPERVREARHFVARMLGDAHPHAETAVLLTSELMTNAIRHTRSGLPGGTVELVVAAKAADFMVSVIDAGSDATVPEPASSPGAENGNGLLLVATLSDDWGHAVKDERTAVWFRMSMSRRLNGALAG
ncbi:MAG TPA: ATP-binding protein [Streptosporangiaceae bacterium]|nr:ATP-binding protein [Streptosporangiaceae bacterium]